MEEIPNIFKEDFIMEVVLEEFKVGHYPDLKQDLAKRKLTKGVVSYECSGFPIDRYNMDTCARKFLLPIHKMLIGNDDYEGGNIVLFVEEVTRGNATGTRFGVLFNKINDWDALPDDILFKHGKNKLIVKNITKG